MNEYIKRRILKQLFAAGDFAKPQFKNNIFLFDNGNKAFQLTIDN